MGQSLYKTFFVEMVLKSSKNKGLGEKDGSTSTI